MIVLVGVLCVGFACDQPRAELRLGISKGGKHGIKIHYAPCPDRPLDVVQLFEFEPPVVGDEDDQLLWEVQNDSGEDVRVVAVGVTPPAFTEEVSLTGLPNGVLGVLVEDSSGQQSGVAFSSQDLREDRVFNGSEDSVTEDEFERLARESCGS